MELGKLNNIKLASKQTKEDKTVFIIVLEIQPSNDQAVKLVQHIADQESVVINAVVEQPILFGIKGGDAGE